MLSSFSFFNRFLPSRDPGSAMPLEVASGNVKFGDSWAVGRTNGPSLGPQKGRQHYARMTVLSSRYGGVNAQGDKFHGGPSYLSDDPQHRRFGTILAFDK
jgi:hypothetical protein